MYQFSSNAGTLQEYIQWLQDNHYWFGQELAKRDICSADFDAAWTWLAQTNYDDFLWSQHEFIKDTFYRPAVDLLAAHYWHIDNHHTVLQDVVWSRAVQYGVGYILDMWNDTCAAMGYPNLSYIDALSFDRPFISTLYLTVCSSESWNSGYYRDSLNERFRNECRDALERIP